MRISIPDGLSPSHRRLFRQEVHAVAQHIVAWGRFESLALMVFAVDLRSTMGFECVSCFHPVDAVKESIAVATGQGRCPALTFPLHFDGGLVLLETYFPDLAEPVRRRRDGIPLVVVDQHDVAVAVLIGRVSTAGSG